MQVLYTSLFKRAKLSIFGKQQYAYFIKRVYNNNQTCLLALVHTLRDFF